MSHRNKCLVLLCASLGLAVVIFAASVWQTSTGQDNPAAGVETPTVSYWHVWTDENGVSHQKRDERSAFKLQSISEGASPSWSDRQHTAGATVVMAVQP